MINNVIRGQIVASIAEPSSISYNSYVYVCLFVLRLNVPVNIFFSHVRTEPPLPGYYQYFPAQGM